MCNTYHQGIFSATNVPSFPLPSLLPNISLCLSISLSSPLFSFHSVNTMVYNIAIEVYNNMVRIALSPFSTPFLCRVNIFNFCWNFFTYFQGIFLQCHHPPALAHQLLPCSLCLHDHFLLLRCLLFNRNHWCILFTLNDFKVNLLQGKEQCFSEALASTRGLYWKQSNWFHRAAGACPAMLRNPAWSKDSRPQGAPGPKTRIRDKSEIRSTHFTSPRSNRDCGKRDLSSTDFFGYNFVSFIDQDAACIYLSTSLS